MRLKDKVAIVTGAGSGIGRACAIRFAEEGANVVVAALREVNGAETCQLVEQAGGKSLLVQTDVRKIPDIQRMVDRTIEVFGKIDILVSNAGVQRFTPFLEVEEEEFDWIIDTNLKGLYFCGQRAAREMVKAGNGGKIINMGSIQSQIGIPGLSHYGSTKGGIRILTKVMAQELAEYNINVNAIGPGATWTNMVGTVDPADMPKFTAQIPLKRWADPREIGDAAVFLASDEASYITGTMLFVDGGWLAK